MISGYKWRKYVASWVFVVFALQCVTILLILSQC